MDILQVCAYAGPAGGNFIASLSALEESMKEKGYNTIYALCETIRETAWARNLESRAKVYYLPVRHARINLKTYSILKHIFLVHDISIVHSHFELYDIPVSLTAPKNVKVFWHLHDPIAGSYEKQRWSRRVLMKYLYKRLSKNAILISCSQKHANFVNGLGMQENHVRYVPNGLDLSRIKKTDITNKDNVFLIFSWDYHRKGADLAIAASDLVYKKSEHFTLRQHRTTQLLREDIARDCKMWRNPPATAVRGRTNSDCQAGPVSQNQIRQSEHDIEFCLLLSQTSVSGLLVFQLSLHHAEDMFYLDPDR